MPRVVSNSPKESCDILALAFLGLFESLAYSSPRIRAGGNVEKTLVGLRILKHSFRFAFDVEHDCLFLFEQLHELAGIAPKGSQGIIPCRFALASMMIGRKKELIVNVSSWAAQKYLGNSIVGGEWDCGCNALSWACKN